MFDIIAITLDAAIDVLVHVGILTLIVAGMCPADKSRSHLVQIERGKSSPWRIRK